MNGSRYSADSLNVTSRKTLDLVETNGRWLSCAKPQAVDATGRLISNPDLSPWTGPTASCYSVFSDSPLIQRHSVPAPYCSVQAPSGFATRPRP